MNLQSLKYFADAARLKSMTKAADLNHLSRPAISQALKRLETEIGVALLNHKRRSFELTQAGHNLYQKSIALFEHIEDIRSSIRQTDGPLIGNFRIGSARTLATFALNEILAQLKEEHPGLEFKVTLQNSQTLVSMLENSELDFAFFIGDETLSGFKQAVVGKGYFCLIGPKTMANSVSFAITERRPEVERLKVLYERKFSQPLPVFAEIPSWDTIWKWSLEGFCGALIPDLILKKNPQVKKQFDIIIDKVFPYEVKILFPDREVSERIARSFIDILKRNEH